MNKIDTPVKGRGYIQISANDELLAGLGNPITNEQWQKALMLPDSYEIERVERTKRTFGPENDIITIFVLNELIPFTQDTCHEVVPYYRVEYVEKEKLIKRTLLDRIEISQWKDGKWELVAVDPVNPFTEEAITPNPQCEIE